MVILKKLISVNVIRILLENMDNVINVMILAMVILDVNLQKDANILHLMIN